MLCVAAVFTPALFMVGPGRALFVPLALAVAFRDGGFLCPGSHLCASHGDMAVAPAKEHAETNKVSRSTRLRDRYGRILVDLFGLRWAVVGIYVVIAMGVVFVIVGQSALRSFHRSIRSAPDAVKAPAGTRVERTESSRSESCSLLARRLAGRTWRVNRIRRDSADELSHQQDPAVDQRAPRSRPACGAEA